MRIYWYLCHWFDCKQGRKNWTPRLTRNSGNPKCRFCKHRMKLVVSFPRG